MTFWTDDHGLYVEQRRLDAIQERARIKMTDKPDEAVKVTKMSDLIEPCKIPPKGWICQRGSGHAGPCAANPLPDGMTEGQYWYGRWWDAMSGDEADLRAAIKPVYHWYQCDEEDDRPLADIIKDIVSDLQDDRKQVLEIPTLRAQLATAREALKVAMAFIPIDEIGRKIKENCQAAIDQGAK